MQFVEDEHDAGHGGTTTVPTQLQFWGLLLGGQQAKGSEFNDYLHPQSQFNPSRISFAMS